jgi:hypothetical protein
LALLTLSQAKAYAGITGNDPVRDAALSEMINEAIDAVKQYCRNGAIERTEYTIILDSPTYTSLILPYTPVRVDGLQVWVNYDANGDPSKFTSEFLYEMYKDYTVDLGQDNVNVSDSGILRSLRGIWGYSSERPVYSLATKIVPNRGAIKVTYTAGYDQVPAAVRGALNIIVRKLYNQRKLGVPLQSESLNGYSYSGQSSATANGILQGDPTVRDMLRPYTRPQVGSYF